MADTSNPKTITLTPGASQKTQQQSALLSPKAEVPGYNWQPVITFKEAHAVLKENDTETTFDLVFDVKIDKGEDGIVETTITRRISINNQAFIREAIGNVSGEPALHLEDAQKKEDSGVAKRMRELAGIPHKGNFI